MANSRADIWSYSWADPRRYVCPEYMKHPTMRHLRFKCVKGKLLETQVGIHMSLIDLVDSFEEMIAPEPFRIPLFVDIRSVICWPETAFDKVRKQVNASFAIFHRYIGSSERLIVWYNGQFVGLFFQLDLSHPQLRYPHNPELNDKLFAEYSLLNRPPFKKMN